jgi:hypothetical protein
MHGLRADAWLAGRLVSHLEGTTSRDQTIPAKVIFTLIANHFGHQVLGHILTLSNLCLQRFQARLQSAAACECTCLGYRGYGTYFFDGAHVIPAESDGQSCDYERVPGCFKVPTEFCTAYWDDTQFVGWSQTGDLCFDVETKAIREQLDALAPSSFVRVPCDDDLRVTTVLVDTAAGSLPYCLLYFEAATDDGTEADAAFATQWSVFLSTGRCFRWNYMDNYCASLAQLAEAVRKASGVAAEAFDVARCVVLAKW